MRHVFTRGAVPTRPRGVMKTTLAGGLVTAGGSTQRVAPGDVRAIGRAVALTPITATAQQDGAAAARTQEESGGRVQRALSDGECG